MDFLCVPSLWEGAPLTIMEAMAAGTPVIASDLPGVRRLVVPGTSADGVSPEPLGLLAAPRDAASFTARMRAILRDPGATSVRAESARRHAFQHFGLDRMLEKIVRVYEE